MKTQAPRTLLILDLDETLIHGSETVLHRPADFRVGPFHLYRRPFLDRFLRSVASVYDLAIWSSASEGYVLGIAEELQPLVGSWIFTWSRERCAQRRNFETLETDFLKDLRKARRFGCDLNRMLIVDDTSSKVRRNYGNAIYVSPFVGSDDDSELVWLERYLLSLSACPNFRTLEKRGWRSRFASHSPQDPR